MNCEQALHLISARIDRELPETDQPALAEHLLGCPACAATADTVGLQDTELRRAFASRREALADVEDRIIAQLRVGAYFTPRRQAWLNRRMVGVLSAVAMLAGLVFVWQLGSWQSSRMPWSEPASVPVTTSTIGIWRGATQSPLAQPAAPGGTPVQQVGLTPRPRVAPPAAVLFPVGDRIQTEAGERRRTVLPDGSIIYLNQNTSVSLETSRRLRLSSGEVFVEDSSAAASSTSELTVQTAQQEISAHRGKLAVTATAAGTGVLVAQGKAWVSGLQGLVVAGQQLKPGASEVTPAPRASHALDWTRDLMAAAESPLVPGSKYGGGALLAVDPQGQEARLSLRKFHVDVHIEADFARTTIDQTYFNHAPWRMEGTFFFPLPPDASLSRLAMYVDGNLTEGGMADREHARRVYETILRTQRDPALLEWVDGSTFKMRVFPLEARQEKRIILSYIQRLPTLYGRTAYRFPTGHSLDVVRDWSFRAHVRGGARLLTSSSTHPHLNRQVVGTDLELTATARDVKLDRDLAFDLTADDAAATLDTARFSSAEHEGSRYLMVRYRPSLQVEARPERRDWIFLFESAADRDPLLARTQVEIVRSILAHADAQDTFAVVTAAARVHRLDVAPRPVNAANVQAALDFLDGSHLVGALDLGQAFAAAASYQDGGGNAYLVHVGSGIPTLGERRDDALRHKLPAGVRYVGIGVGKRWNRAFMKQAAERSGGYFTQINPDEPIAWRCFELVATLNTPRLLNVQIVDNAEQASFLTFASTAAQGEEIAAVTRLEAGQSLPTSVTLRGSLDGEVFERVLPVRAVEAQADYLPRTWAKLEIDRLLALDAAQHKAKITELSKSMYVMTPFTSLLVLENEEMYRQYRVDRGRKDHWALYPCPAKIPVVHEPDPNQPPARADGTLATTREQVLQSVVVRMPPRFWHASEQPESRQGQVVLAWDFAYRSNLSRGAVRFAEFDDSAVDLLGRTLGKQRLSDLGLDISGVEAGFAFKDPGSATKLGRNQQLDGYFVDLLGESSHEGLKRGYLADRFGSWGLGIPAGTRVLRTGEARQSTRLEDLAAGQWDRSEAFLSEQLLTGEAKLDDALVGDYKRRARGFYAMPNDRLFAAESSGNGMAGEVVSGSLAARLLAGQSKPPPLYRRPSFAGDQSVFGDLVAYAPGLQASRADFDTAVEGEAAPQLASMPGTIDAGARALIDRVRGTGWMTIKLAEPKGALTFDGQGRFVREGSLPFGMHERVICDGTTLWHVYPELSLAARRIASRFHRSELLGLVPWALPPVEDLARGADVRLIAEHVVGIFPRNVERTARPDNKRSPYAVRELHFTNGRLSERRVVKMPDRVTLLRETYETDGHVRMLNGKDEVVAERKLDLSPAAPPRLVPDTDNMLVLGLPWRSRPHVYAQLGLVADKPLDHAENRCFEYLPAEQAVELFAAEFAAGNGPQARRVLDACFAAKGPIPLGYYVLLAACNLNVGADPIFRERWETYRGEPLARYLVLQGSPAYRHLQQHGDANLGDLVAPPENFLGRLARFNDLVLRWSDSSPNLAAGRAGQQRIGRALDFVRREHGSPFGLALLGLLQDRAAAPAFHAALAEAWRACTQPEPNDYIVRYEQARSLLRAGRRDEARTCFRELYAQALARGVLPPIDADLRHALLGDKGQDDAWNELMLSTASKLAQKYPLSIVTLAWQCWQLGDQPMATRLLAVALPPGGAVAVAGPAGTAEAVTGNGTSTSPTEHLTIGLAAVEFLWRTQQLAYADLVMQELCRDARYCDRPTLWRVSARLAGERGMQERAITCLEKALDLEYAQLPEVINLQAVRQDYGRVLGHYKSLAGVQVTMAPGMPADLLPRTIKAADQWRALDRDASGAAEAAAAVARALGEAEVAWDYLTTPLASTPRESAAWRDLGQRLGREGEPKLADKAFAAACEADPSNAQLLWERYQNLAQSGFAGEAGVLLRRLVESDWPEQYESMRSQARRLLEDR